MLIVDDSEVSRASLQAIFEKNYSVFCVDSGVAALKLLQDDKERFSIILLDMLMPEMNGEEFLNRKNALPGAREIPVVVISTADDVITQINMLKLGVHDYITKPYVAEAVERRVGNVLDYSNRFRILSDEYRKTALNIPDYNRMLATKIYSPREIKFLLRFMGGLFDFVQLVDPVETRLISVDDNDQLIYGRKPCFSVWEREARCKNCSGGCALKCKNCITKYEAIENDIFYVISNPIGILLPDGKRVDLVMELVSHVSGHLLTDEINGKSIGQMLDETQKKIYTDELTAVYNRRYLKELVQSYLGFFVQKGISVIMLDIRDFKRINDRYGHGAGGVILKKLAGVLQTMLRKNDAVIRYGGDEFLLILSDCEEHQVQGAIERICRAVEEIRYGENNQQRTYVDVGYSYYIGSEILSDTFDRMIAEADRAMYEKKRLAKAQALRDGVQEV